MEPWLHRDWGRQRACIVQLGMVDHRNNKINSLYNSLFTFWLFYYLCFFFVQVGLEITLAEQEFLWRCCGKPVRVCVCVSHHNSIFPGSFIYELFQNAQVTFDTKTAAVETMEQITGYLANRESLHKPLPLTLMMAQCQECSTYTNTSQMSWFSVPKVIP